MKDDRSMNLRWYFTFVGGDAFECDETQVIVNGTPVEAIGQGFCVVRRLGGATRFINMANVKFIDIFATVVAPEQEEDAV